MVAMELRGGVAVVTGAAGGIGLALTRRLVAEEMRVVMADVDAGRLTAAAREVGEHGGEVLAVPTDVARWEDVESLARHTAEHFGPVRLLCNNAGVNLGGRAWRVTLEDWQWLLGVNLWGAIHGIRAFVPAMIERGEPAHVVNTASIAGLLGFPAIAMYSTSKFAVVGLSESLLQDLRARDADVGVSVLCPGETETDLLWNSRHLRPGGAEGEFAPPPETERMSPDDVAARVVDAVRERRFLVLTHPEHEELLELRLRTMLGTGHVLEPGAFLPS